MSGIEEYAKSYEIEWLQEQIYELQSQVRDLEAKFESVLYQPPIEPYQPYGGVTTCAKCGMRWEGVMGYVCIQPGCPVQMQVTSQI